MPALPPVAAAVPTLPILSFFCAYRLFQGVEVPSDVLDLGGVVVRVAEVLSIYGVPATRGERGFGTQVSSSARSYWVVGARAHWVRRLWVVHVDAGSGVATVGASEGRRPPTCSWGPRTNLVGASRSRHRRWKGIIFTVTTYMNPRSTTHLKYWLVERRGCLTVDGECAGSRIESRGGGGPMGQDTSLDFNLEAQDGELEGGGEVSTGTSSIKFAPLEIYYDLRGSVHTHDYLSGAAS
ncbi:hypothetical protein B0H16DRAFT_1452615 [Mycena metata]|uniref:Uncharacterized protein n=1 Tax=Mycena metata TaxID=1033252 RepID=A0AAD7JPU0_9AGAR|nr:hypothetical protein B0H16DRAFT_1452615 [Mycena metata]